MTSDGAKIFITGATGDIGGQLLKLLQDANLSFRILCRRQKQVDDFTRCGIDVVRGSLDDDVSDLAASMGGCDRLFLNTAATPDQLQHNKNAIDAAIQAGVKWIVKITASDARNEGTVPWVRAHWTADNYLRDKTEQCGMRWTLLKPSAFMQNLISSAPPMQKGFLPQTGGQGKCGWVDTADVAAVACQVLVEGAAKHDKQEYILTGPQLISFPDIADALSRQIGHKVRYLHLSGPVFGLMLRLSGMDAWYAAGVVAQFVEIVRPNKEGIEATNTIEKITGKASTSIDQFVAQNKDKFQGYDALPRIIGVLGVVGVIAVALVAQGLRS